MNTYKGMNKDMTCKDGFQYEPGKTYQMDGPVEALRYLGCYRLGARICELRREGFNIITIMKEETKDDGTVCRFASYKLVQPLVVAA